ncbi:hypothetical protein ABGF26_02585 [Helcococcus ovis]|uniref:hypothetical protein n=1 Tax=Helcococcus ovis TaxID=72026 RepID=UPI0038BC1406
MKRLTINSVLNDKEVVEYRGYAIKDNNTEVEVVFTVQELAELVKKVESTRTNDEVKQEIINKIVTEQTAKGQKVDDRLLPEWQENAEYEKDQPVKKFGVVYYANKKHKSDNQSNPIFDDVTWRKEIKVTQKPENENEEYTNNINKALQWNREDTFKVNTYVKWYGSLYKATVTISDNAEPGRDSRWLKIEKEAKKE